MLIKSWLIKSNQGIVLIATLLVVSALSTIGIIAVNNTSMDLKVSGNVKDIKRAFLNAEAGVRHAIKVLEDSDNGFDDELSAGVLAFGPSVAFEGGSYEVYLSDNKDESTNDPYLDSDGTVIITSTGKVNGASQTIEVLFNKIVIPVDVDGALALYEDDPYLEVRGSPAISGGDWNVPDVFDCAGVDNGTLTDNPAIAGVYAPDDLEVNLIGGGSDTDQITGNPPIDEGGGVDSDSYTNQDWLDLAYQLIGRADITLVGGFSPGITGNQVFGTRAAPKIVVVENDTKFAGNVCGVGILILKDGVTFQGTFTFEGLVIILNTDNDAGYELELGQGNASIFGCTVIAGIGSPDVRMRGNADIKYSSQALRTVADALTSSKILSWRNKY